MATIELTDTSFAETINSAAMLIVDFWAPWCGPCRSFAPVYEQMSEKYPGIVFAKVNTEQEQALAGHFQIRSIPTLMIFREQIIIFMQPGALPGAALEQIIEKANTLDMDQVRREIAEQQQSPRPESA